MRSNALAASLLFAVAAPCQTFFPPPPAPPENQPTTQKVYLGFVLFHEEQMSSDNSVACRSCHSFQTGGTDARQLKTNPGFDGVYGTADDIVGSQGQPLRNAAGDYAYSARGFEAQVTPRKAPSMVNIAYADRLFYDGRARTGDFRDPISNQITATGATALEHLILQPPLNPVEMGAPGRTWSDVVAKLAVSRPLQLADQVPTRIAQFIANSSYQDLFQRTFGTPAITPTRVAFAIASYMRTLISDQTRFDYALAGSLQLTAQEMQGKALFETRPNTFNGAAQCTQCHGDLTMQSHQAGPSATNTTMYGQLPSGNFHNTGVRPIQEDFGSGGFTGNSTDNGRFKVPFMRNVALHSRFFHNGSMTSLDQVVDFYSRGGDFHTQQAVEIQARNFTAAEKAALIAFFNTLTDPRVAAGTAPFDTVRLGSERNAFRPTPLGAPSTGMGPNIPVMVAQEPVFLGTPKVTFGVHHVAPNAWVALAIDTASNPTGIDLLGVKVYLGGQNTQIASLGVSKVATDGTGYASASFNVPNLPNLAGSTVTAQWFSVDPSAPVGIAASAAVDINL